MNKKIEKEILESNLLLTAQTVEGLKTVYDILMEEFFDREYNDRNALAHDFRHYKKMAHAVEALLQSVQNDLKRLLDQ